MSRVNGTGRAIRDSPHIRLYHWLTRSEAWRSLDTVARCAYLEFSGRYRGPGSNNGRLPFSVREMAQALNTSKATALRAIRRLQDRGFVVLTKMGAFKVKVRHANEWRLTEFGCDVTGAIATRDFMKWRKNTVSPQHPIECPSEPV